MALAINVTNGCGLSNGSALLVTIKEEQGNAVFAIHFGPLTSCTLLTRQSASVLKVGVPCMLQSLQRQTGL